jgi:hypothetical protein
MGGKQHSSPALLPLSVLLQTHGKEIVISTEGGALCRRGGGTLAFRLCRCLSSCLSSRRDLLLPLLLPVLSVVGQFGVND